MPQQNFNCSANNRVCYVHYIQLVCALIKAIFEFLVTYCKLYSFVRCSRAMNDQLDEQSRRSIDGKATISDELATKDKLIERLTQQSDNYRAKLEKTEKLLLTCAKDL